ncbi:MAG: right-handed parallel beta-helix repeat-containing protein [Actinobacteria bacterium]|nr:right-handed parallel beta-helix repeat-containing protein [Actinomycetota bacterium]
MAVPAAAEHIACGTVITASTALDSDIGPCPGDGLIISASDVTLDLKNFRIFAANGAGDNAGIRLTNVTNVTVMNGTVEGFDAGIVIEGGSGNTVRHVTARNNINDFGGRPCTLGDGIALINSDNNTITQSEAIHNGPFGGISIVGDSDNNVITHNLVQDNNVVSPGTAGCGNTRQDEGIRIEGPGAEGNRIENNRVLGSLLAGIGLHSAWCFGGETPNNGNFIINNIVNTTAGTGNSSGIAFLENGPAGRVCPASNTTIERNTVTDNEGDGIFVASNSSNNVLTRNVVERNGRGGIVLDGPEFRNTFTNVGPTVLDLVQPDRPPFVQGTDYRVMPGSGSGNVTGRLVPIDIKIGGTGSTNTNAVDTSNSGCEQADYDAAGFQAGDVALIQRGTCTFVAKVNLAIANGASAVVMFNEGQQGRTTFAFGAVGPVNIPVVSTTFAVGRDLFNLAQAGTVTINVVTNTTNVQTQVTPGATNNTLVMNTGQGNAEFDGFDGTLEPPCDNNKWDRNGFGTVNQPCVAEAGRGQVREPRGSGKPRPSDFNVGRGGDAESESAASVA